MSDHPNEIHPMDDVIRTTPEVVPMGPVMVKTPVGEVLFLDSIHCSATLATPADQQSDPVITLMPVVRWDGALIGTIIQLDADGARHLAAALCQLADKMGAVRQ